MKNIHNALAAEDIEEITGNSLKHELWFIRRIIRHSLELQWEQCVFLFQKLQTEKRVSSLISHVFSRDHLIQ
jgi:hypothetical protein